MEFLQMMSKMEVHQDPETTESAKPAVGGEGGENNEGKGKKICIKPQKKLAEFIMKIYQYVLYTQS